MRSKYEIGPGAVRFSLNFIIGRWGYALDREDGAG
jgi:hypothetical protein